MAKPVRTIDAYIRSFPRDVQWVLETLRQTIRTAAPREAIETITYNMPTFELDGTYLVYFAGWKKHVSLYPVSHEMEQSIKGLAAYKTSGRGTIRFPLEKPLPVMLIRRIVKQRVNEVRNKTRPGQ